MFIKYSRFYFVVLGSFIFFQSIAQASLLISPMRVVFDDRERGKTVAIINGSNKTNTYRIEMINLKQLPNGEYEELKDEESFQGTGFYAKDMIRTSPRQVTLKPGERQSVRISLRKPANLADGEYRSHLKFVQLPSPEMLDQNPNNAGIKLYMLTGFSIPVQVRQGQPNVSSKIVSASLKQSKEGFWGVETTINRQGDFSSFGKLTVLWRASSNDSYQELNFLNNVALYREIKTRTINIALKKEQLKYGQYRVVFEGDKAFAGKVFDEYEFNYKAK